MTAWVKEEENASKHRQRKREAEEADKVEVVPGVTVASLRRFRAALILNKNLHASKPSQHSPNQEGLLVKTFRWNHRP